MLFISQRFLILARDSRFAFWRGTPAGLQPGHGFSADVSTARMAKSDLEQTTPKTILATWRTYPPPQPTYSAVSEFAPHLQVGGSDTVSDLQVETTGVLKLHLRKSIDCCKHFEYECPFSGKFEEKH